MAERSAIARRPHPGLQLSRSEPIELALGQHGKQAPTQVGARPSYNPEDEKHQVITNFDAWHGTLVGINIRGFEAKLDAFMARMKTVLNTGAMQPTPKINFT